MTIDQRVEQLERKCRQLRHLVTGLLMAIAATVLVAAAPNPAKDRLQTQSLEIVDGDGKVRIRLGPADEGYGLVVYDQEGRFRATFTDAPRGAAMSLKKDGGSISLMAMQEECGMTIRDQNGKPRALMLLQEGVPAIMLKDEAGENVFLAPK